MPDPHDPDPDVIPLNSGDPLARELQALKPTSSRVDRDAVLYAAGQAARARILRRWQALAAVQFLAIAGGSCFWLLSEPPAQPEVAPVVSPKPEPVQKPKSPEPAAPSEEPAIFAADNEGSDIYRGLRRRADVIAGGGMALPSPVAPPPTADATELERGLRLPKGVLAIPVLPKKPDAEPEK
jgi:hypothetical protein